ncbi:hypothetical protein SARC_00813 [Sphaeroforma arctica JP610]|uniref:Fe-containing alcohol dehydrogenase-like C-terminal domain-containing protein n=1 Tax=Sphaeroforma arctica JP610 TaxID=667725 RepID=A0A0L0GDV8_9EUKA|nr:hypothetical protein SARC_00813 [Sphaeroforma arctica JP610]KNC87069.1 hypothetical protein SARC_00813 [Sphaeroforma arctica JP610]|eukprot:XP_014160971.1 hypothetical protein SARC_00813 [Sphaeroforma arctica JP610]
MLPGSPHGAVCAVLLPIVIEVNVRELAKDAQGNALMLQKYKQAAIVCTSNPGASVEDMVVWLIDLCSKLGVAKLSAYGMKESDIPVVVDKAAASSSMKGNSLILNKECLSEILTRAL